VEILDQLTMRERVDRILDWLASMLYYNWELLIKILKSILFILILTLIILLLWYVPPHQVSSYRINNTTENASLENQYRATLAQIVGGAAIIISLFYTSRRIGIAEKDLKATKEGQMTERFTKAVDQLGNPAIETRLGGIYALARISNESWEDYWPIMEILTGYIRNNSSLTLIKKGKLDLDDEVSVDIQSILTVIKKRKYSFYTGDSGSLDLQKTFLRRANLEYADFERANLEGVNLTEANFEHAKLNWVNLKGGADLTNANLEHANLENAFLEGANLTKANLEYANLENAHLKGANLEEANLKNAENLEYYQFKDVTTLHNATIDEPLHSQLYKMYPEKF
jgi:Pentapeptide repeats (8 copies)